MKQSVNANRWRALKTAGVAFAITALIFGPLSANPYYLTVLISVGIAVIMGAGFRLIFISGRFSLGQAGFWGFGAYTSALLAVKLGVNFWLGLILGGILSMIAAVLFGCIALRLAGMYFVIMTLCLSEFARYFYLWARPLTGGATGIIGVPPPTISIAGARIDFGNNLLLYYYLLLAIVFVSVLVMYRMEHSRIGRAFHAMRQNDVLAEHLGINLTRYRVLAFATACFFTGVAGAFFAHYTQYVSPDDFTIMESLYAQLYGIVGGLGHPVGPVIGAIFIVSIVEVFRITKEVQPIFLGGLLIITMLFFPRGIIGLRASLSTWMKKRGNFVSEKEIS